MNRSERREPCLVAATSSQGIVEGTMKLEAAKGASHAANAAAAFIHAVQQHLPREAFEELRGLSLNQVRQWAEKWGVDAPCILEIARDWCEGGWNEGETVDAYCGPAIPREWFEQLNELNRLPVDAGWLETGLENIMSDGERRAELGELKSFRVELLKEDRALAALAPDAVPV